MNVLQQLKLETAALVATWGASCALDHVITGSRPLTFDEVPPAPRSYPVQAEDECAEQWQTHSALCTKMELVHVGALVGQGGAAVGDAIRNKGF